jgi:endonuclease YncB( thermonuclease family)
MTSFAASAWTSITSRAKAEWDGSPERRTTTKAENPIHESSNDPTGRRRSFGRREPALAAKPHYEITGQVVKIADGDTLTVLDESKTQHKIRLAGIDAPEKAQAFGTKARENLAAKVLRQTVRVEVIDVDRYHRRGGPDPPE